jgi:hypothetical protein
MSIPPEMLATISASVALLGHEFLKGGADEAGKNAWSAIKHLFGWSSDPPEAELPATVSKALESSPEIPAKVLEILKSENLGAPSAMVGNITNVGGTIKIVNTIIANRVEF